jgi:hypothetical protein
MAQLQQRPDIGYLTDRVKAIRHGVTIKWIIDFTRL